MFLVAHLPKASEPPALLIKATKLPKNTKNANIPAVPFIASIIPLLITLSTVKTMLKLVTRSPPQITPIISEE